MLPRVDSAAQEKYANGRVTLYLDGEKALVTEDTIVLAGRCESAVALPAAPQMRYSVCGSLRRAKGPWIRMRPRSGSRCAKTGVNAGFVLLAGGD